MPEQAHIHRRRRMATLYAANCGAGSHGYVLREEPIGFKYHQGADARTVCADSGVSPTLTADYHQPAVAFSKTYRPHFAGDAETWQDTGLANTLNCFDGPSDQRFNEVVCMIGR